MKKLLTENVWTKIFSVLIALALWLFVVVKVNPDTDIKISNIPVLFSEYSSLEENGLAIVGFNQPEINVKLKGPRRFFKELNNTNVKAIVNLASLTEPGETELPITVRLPIDGFSVTEKSLSHVSLTIEKLEQVEKPVNVILSGKTATGFVAINPKSSINTVKLKGPESVVKLVDKVNITLDVTDASDDVISTVKPSFHSSSGVEITDSEIICEPDVITANCGVFKHKQVPITVPVEGSSANEVLITLPQGDAIECLAKADIIDSVTSLETVPLDISKIKKDTTVELKINAPDNVVLNRKTVTVQVTVANKE